jgi:hypothetical protein
MRRVYLALLVPAVLAAQNTGAGSATTSLLDIKRIYVAPLTGGKESAALRDLIIAGLDSTKLFLLTENPDRADAILKGAADDNTFTDTFDSGESVNAHQTLGKYGSGASAATRTGGGYGAVAMGENDIHHIKERKHEAYAAVRLCNKDGDVLWSTTQESVGAKFRGASADVAAKIAHQLTIDYDRARRPTPASDAGAPVPKP